MALATQRRAGEVGGPLALTRGQQEKQGCAVAAEGKGRSSHFFSSSRAHSKQPAPVLNIWLLLYRSSLSHFEMTSVLSQAVCSEACWRTSPL